MDRETLTEETIAAEEAGDSQRVEELARLERLNKLDEAEPRYADGASDGGDTGATTGDLEERMESAARANELAGAESTAQALRRLKGAEDPESALRKAHRRAQSLGDEYNATEFGELLGE